MIKPGLRVCYGWHALHYRIGKDEFAPPFFILSFLDTGLQYEMMFSFIDTFENIGSAAELVGPEINEICAGVTRVDGLVFKHFAHFIDAGTTEAIHDMHIITQIDIVEEAPAEVIVGDKADVAVFIRKLEFGGGVGDAGDIFRPAGGLLNDTQEAVLAKVNTADTFHGMFTGFSPGSIRILFIEYHLFLLYLPMLKKQITHTRLRAVLKAFHPFQKYGLFRVAG